MRIDIAPGDDVASVVAGSDAESIVLVMPVAPPGFVEAVLRPTALAIAPRRLNAVVGDGDDVEPSVAFLDRARFTTAQAIVLDQPRVRPQAPSASITT